MEEAGLAWIGQKKAAATRMLGNSLAGALVDDSEDYGLLPALMAAMEAEDLLADAAQDVALFTDTADAMNAQAADVADRVTDSEYHVEDETPVETQPESMVMDPVREAEAEPQASAPVHVPSVALDDATQPSFWDLDARFGDNGEQSEPVPVGAAPQPVQAGLPGM